MLRHRKCQKILKRSIVKVVFRNLRRILRRRKAIHQTVVFDNEK